VDRRQDRYRCRIRSGAGRPGVADVCGNPGDLEGLTGGLFKFQSSMTALGVAQPICHQMTLAVLPHSRIANGRPISELGHSRPSRLARNPTYDRSCLKADIRRAPTGLLLEIEIPERLPGGVLHHEARIVVLLDRPGRREAA
jgi:hypothetical protein